MPTQYATSATIEQVSKRVPRMLLARRGSDAHVRMAMLIGTYADGANEYDRGEAIGSSIPWRKRARAAIRCAELSSPYTIVDLDAIAETEPSDGPRPDDASNLRERAWFFQKIMELGAEKKWTFLRLDPKPSVGRLLDALGVRDESRRTDAHLLYDPGPDEQPLYSRISPVLRPVARWLVAMKRIEERSFRRVLDMAKEPDTVLFEAYIDAIGPTARDALFRISMLREEHSWNGVAGPFSANAEGHLVMTEVVRKRLIDSGAIHVCSSDVGNTFYVPSSLRDRLAVRYSRAYENSSRMTRHDIAAKLWGQYGSPGVGEACTCSSIEIGMEVHRQAVLSHDLQLSKMTARYSAGVSLRYIAMELSRQGQTPGLTDEVRADCFRKAAELYKTITQSHDEEDGYSWQYYAFNRQMQFSVWSGEGKFKNFMGSDEITADIKQSYERSCELSEAYGANLLFHGRRLSFLLHINTPVTEVFGQLMPLIKNVRERYGDDDRSGLPWLILPLRAQLKSIRWPLSAQQYESRSAWAELLLRCPVVGQIEKRRSPTPLFALDEV